MERNSREISLCKAELCTQVMLSLSTKIIAVALGLGIAWPLYAVEIINNVSSSASTGSNLVNSGGEIIQGESKANVKIYTEIDGEVVTDIDETVTAPAGEDAVIEKNVEVNLSNVKSSTSVEAQVSGEETSSVQSSILHTVVSPVLAFINKIFKYVFSIFTV